jgi:hypothetical protein
MDAELLPPSVPITDSSVVLPPILLLTNTIPAGLVEGRICRGKIAERCSFTCKSCLCTVAE